MYDFFISHSSKDKDSIVEELYERLSLSKYNVWYDKEKIGFGNNINEEIDEGLKQSFCLLLIITKNFFDSKWVFFEFGKYSAYQKSRIIPIIFDISTEECLQIIQILGNVKYINAKDKTTDEIAQILGDSLTAIKENNEELTIKDEIYKIYKKIKSQEDINSGFVCISLNEYLEVSDKYQSYIVFSAKKVALEILKDTTKFFELKIDLISNDFNVYLNALESKISKNIYDYFCFILNSDVYLFDENYINLINNALLAVIQWYYNIKFSSKPYIFSLSITLPGEMKHEDFKETDEIDYLVLRDDLIASVETAIEWYEYNNYSYIAAKDTKTGKIVGYMTLLPITEDTYNQILSGDFMDKDFTKDSILQYDYPGLYTIYIASVAIHPVYQNSNVFFELYNATIDMFLGLAKQREIYVEKIIAEASTKQGEKLCKLLKMKKYCSTTNNTDIYTLTLIPPEFKLFGTKGKQFMNLYKQKYEEYHEFFEEL